MPCIETATVLRHDCAGPGLHELELSAADRRGRRAGSVRAHARSASLVRSAAVVGPGSAAAQAAFSISDADSNASGSITILYKVRGRHATTATVRPGDRLDVMGPWA